MLLLIIFLLVAFHAFVTKGMKFYKVPSSSMEPTLYPEDRIIVVEVPRIRRGDILVFRYPNDPSSFMVKRVIALPQDEVEIKNGTLYLNGKPKKELYIKEKMEYTSGPEVVPENHLFVLGDNRNYSKDSSVWGFLPQEKVIGKVVFVYWPINRRGPVR